MEKIFALVKNNLVVNTIVVENESILDILSAQGVHDFSVRIDGCHPRPGVNWAHELVDEGDKFIHFDNALFIVVKDNQTISGPTLIE